MILICSMMFFTLSARAQFVNDKYEEMVRTMDRVADEHKQAWSNVATAGINEERKSQEKRFNEMHKSVDEAISRHYNTIEIKEDTILHNKPKGDFVK